MRPVRLTAGQENLEIQYTGLSWSRPQAIKFRFRLSGLDRDWVDAGARRTAYYSHLPPGAYTFNVTANNGEGVWNATGDTLAIVVLPRFYQTWWFRIAVASSLVDARVVVLAISHRSAEAAQAAQQAFSRQLIESQERERQRIAAELHDSLGQNLLVVKNRALLGALSQPDEEARKQFDEIGATVAQTLEEVRTISYNLRPHHLDQLGLTTTIRAMIEKVAESSAITMSSELDDIDGVFPPADEITHLPHHSGEPEQRGQAFPGRRGARRRALPRASRRDHDSGRRPGVRRERVERRSGSSRRLWSEGDWPNACTCWARHTRSNRARGAARR